MFAFDQLSLGVNIGVFAAAAVVVWMAGTKLSAYVDEYADRTGLGKAFAGALILGGTTSLPELATTLTASYSGAAELAGTNLLGGVTMQVAVLAVVDMIVMRGRPLTLFSPRPSLLMIGVTLIMLTAICVSAVSSGELFSIGGVGFWPTFIFIAYIGSLWITYKYEGDPRWEPTGEIAQPPESAKDLKDANHEKYVGTSNRYIIGMFSVVALLVLTGGYFVAKSGEAIAAQSGLGQSFVGATLVALATSLPEVSTTYSAVRFGAYSMAAANILGTNAIAIALFFPAELAFRGGSIFDAMQPSASFLAALGIVVTCLYLWGILERRDRTILGMGWDSFAVLVVYLLGLVVYYFI